MGFLKVLRAKKRFIIKKVLPKYFVRSGFLSSIYYLLFDKSFYREHRSVLAGKLQHINSNEAESSSYYTLVRNTHRIEKGLLMRPRRPVYAKNYIGETISCFIKVWNPVEIVNNKQMKWFHDVLQEYFVTASKDPQVFPHYERFTKTLNGNFIQENSCKSIPYTRIYQNKSEVTFDDFYKLVKQRRSVRWFKDQKVPREYIDKSILAANQSPSACNRQPFEFRIFDDPDLVRKVVGFPMGTSGYGHSIPVMVIIVGNLDAYFDERDRHVMYIDASLAAMSLMLALETQGLSSCAINWPDIEEREEKMHKFLNLKDYQRPLMCLGLGYPDYTGLVAYSEKRPLDTIRKYN